VVYINDNLIKNNLKIKKMRNLMFILIFGFVLSILLPLPALIGGFYTVIVLGIIFFGITIFDRNKR
jgi:hypothetical protein